MSYTGFRFTGRNAALSRPSDKPPAVVGDTWARDRTSPTSNDGTEVDATFLNRVKANLENLVVGLGGDPSAGDDQLITAIQTALQAYATTTDLEDFVALGATLAALADGDGFVRMTDAERAKLSGLPTNYKGSFASMAALAVAVPAGAAGDWAIVTQGVGNAAVVALWDTDDSIWVNTQASPATIAWAAVTGKPSDITNITSLLAAKAATDGSNITGRLAAGSKDISGGDWDNEVDSGWVLHSLGSPAANAPTVAAYAGLVLRSDNSGTSYIRQIAFARESALIYTRRKAGTWSAWTRLPDNLSTAADFRTGTSDGGALSPKAVWDAAALVALTDGATIAVDMGAGLNFSVTLGGNRTLGNPTNAKPGEGGTIYITQDGTGSRTLAYASNWKFAGGVAPVLSTAAGAIDHLHYKVKTSSLIEASLNKDVK